MFRELQKINQRPKPFEFYTASDLWTDEHTSEQMLTYHLNGAVDVSSRKSEFIDRSAGWIVSRFGLGPGMRVLDFGCGPGLYTLRLARTGATVVGVDFSPRSIAFARQAAQDDGQSIEYVQQNYLEYESGARFDVILMIMCDFCALSPNQRQTMLRKFGALLNPDGSVILDVYSLASFSAREEMATYGPQLLDGFWSPRPYYGFQNTFKYEKEKAILDKFVIVEEDRTRTVYNWLQCFTPESLRSEFETAGLAFDSVHADVSGAEYDPYATEFAVIVRKS